MESKVQTNPHSLAFARLADFYLEEDRVDDAIQLCLDGLEGNPTYTTGYFVLAKAYLLKNDLENAETTLKKVLSHDRHYLSAHKYLGDIMVKLGWENSAINYYKDILQIDPLESTAQAALGNLSEEPAEMAEMPVTPLPAEESMPLEEDLVKETPAAEEEEWISQIREVFPDELSGQAGSAEPESGSAMETGPESDMLNSMEDSVAEPGVPHSAEAIPETTEPESFDGDQPEEGFMAPQDETAETDGPSDQASGAGPAPAFDFQEPDTAPEVMATESDMMDAWETISETFDDKENDITESAGKIPEPAAETPDRAPEDVPEEVSDGVPDGMSDSASDGDTRIIDMDESEFISAIDEGFKQQDTAPMPEDTDSEWPLTATPEETSASEGSFIDEAAASPDIMEFADDVVSDWQDDSMTGENAESAAEPEDRKITEESASGDALDEETGNMPVHSEPDAVIEEDGESLFDSMSFDTAETEPDIEIPAEAASEQPREESTGVAEEDLIPIEEAEDTPASEPDQETGAFTIDLAETADNAEAVDFDETDLGSAPSESSETEEDLKIEISEEPEPGDAETGMEAQETGAGDLDIEVAPDSEDRAAQTETDETSQEESVEIVEISAVESKEDDKPEKQPEEPASGEGPATPKILTPTLGEIYIAQEQYHKALEIFKKLAELNPKEKKYQEKIKLIEERIKDTNL